MQALEIEVFESSEEAAKAGYIYRDPVIGLVLKKAIIIKNGTMEGNATVDLILEDGAGNKYVAMPTGNLLNAIRLIKESVDGSVQ